MFCCKDLDENSQRIKNPQPPRFKDKKSGKAYPCVDQTSRCRQWANIPNSCSSDQELNPYYHFMREVCQASCSEKEKEKFWSNKCAKVQDDHSKMRHFAKLATYVKYTIFLQTTWNFGKIIFSCGVYIDQVS